MRRSSSSLEPQPTDSGFTRIELLAIVACLALLALAQLPSLGKSREGGHEAVCMNNLRQLGLAMLMYAGENQDIVPEEGSSVVPLVDSSNFDAWYNLAVQPRYPRLCDLYNAGTVPLPQYGSIYSCPACPPPNTPGPSGITPPYKNPPTAFFAFFMYAENGRICINKSTRIGRANTKLSQVPKPSDTILMAEQDTTTASDPAESSTIGSYAVGRHNMNTRGNFTMADGSVRSATTNDFKRTSAESNSAAAEWATPRTMYWYPTPTTPN